MTLDLALITHRPEGMARIAAQRLPRVEGVRYVISWQAHAGAPIPPEVADRQDIEVHRFDRSGQSLNRNNAIDHCRADIVLHADDDVSYTAEGLLAVIQAFEQRPQMDVATFMVPKPGGPAYPPQECRLGIPMPKGYWVATFEIAFRRSRVGSLRCHPEFGLGSPRLHGGEDELFLLEAIRRGLNCRFLPIEIGRHPHESTGTKAHLTAANLRAQGCLITLTYPRTALLRIPLKAWRTARAGQHRLLPALCHLLQGMAYTPRILRGPREYLW